MLPLRTFLRADPDPLVGVIGLGRLDLGEVAVLQVLFEPAREQWADSVRKAVTDAEGSSFFLDAPELTRLALEKIAHPLFAVVLRMAASAPEKRRAQEIADTLAGTLTHFGRPDGNELALADNELDIDLERISFAEPLTAAECSFPPASSRQSFTPRRRRLWRRSWCGV